MKATAILDNNGWRDLYKNPVTDSVKRSLRGRVTVYRDNNERIFSDYIGLSSNDVIELMETVYLNGKITKQYTFEEILQNN